MIQAFLAAIFGGGADVLNKDKEGNSVLDWANAKGPRAVQVLKDALDLKERLLLFFSLSLPMDNPIYLPREIIALIVDCCRMSLQ